MTVPGQAVALMYHDVTDGHPPSGFQRQGARPYTLRHDRFDEHLGAIAASPLRPATVDRVDLTAAHRHLFLTFDDGGRSAVHIAERLSERGWQGHFFIVTGRIGKRTFLDASQIRDIHRMGHHVGTHSHTHPDIFWDLPLWRMRAEWAQSRQILSDIIGAPCVSASVPGGDISRAVLESAAHAGLRYLFTSEPLRQIARLGDCNILGRLTVKGDMPLAVLRARLAGRGWTRTLVERRLKVLARRTLAPMYRMYVRRTTRSQSGPVSTYPPVVRVREPES